MGTRVVGLIGYPVAHSISPLFQQAAFDALGIDVRYERWQTEADELALRVGTLRQRRFLGANVTVPHKEGVPSLLDRVEPSASRAGAVNTVCNRDGVLVGLNTDISGFRRALRDSGGFDAGGRRVTVLGAGGAARAVVIALEQEGAQRVMLANRHPARAARLVHDLRTDPGPDLVRLDWEEAVSAENLRTTDLLVNCSTLGLAGTMEVEETPVPREHLHDRLFVCDIVANPLLTPLLCDARAAGARTMGGLAMLVYQGAASFEQWTGQAAPIDTMMRAAVSAMDRTAGSGKQA